MTSRRKAKGFTLIEVTLAIVIGIIMVAGATLIYNQAKTSAGNSRAQAKVVALQQLAEEYAAMSQGIYPETVDIIQALWQRKRPDDWNKSPWGGMVGTSFSNSTNAGGVMTLIAPQATADTGIGHVASGSAATTVAKPDLVGGLFYEYGGADIWTYGNPTAAAPDAKVGDLMTNTQVTVRSFAVSIANQQGKFPNFIAGGKTY